MMKDDERFKEHIKPTTVTKKEAEVFNILFSKMLRDHALEVRTGVGESLTAVRNRLLHAAHGDSLTAVLKQLLHDESKTLDELVDELEEQLSHADEDLRQTPESLKGSQKGPVRKTNTVFTRDLEFCEFLLRLLVRGKGVAAIGDMREEFCTEIVPQYGPSWAKFWYIFQTFRIIIGQLFTAIRRVPFWAWAEVLRRIGSG